MHVNFLYRKELCKNMANQDILMRLERVEATLSALVKHTHYRTDIEIEHDNRIRSQREWEFMKRKTFAGLILLALAGLLGFVKGAEWISMGVFWLAITLLIAPVRM
jgi:hypothetical protein